MKNMKYNERKIQVLEAMTELEEARARDLMDHLGDIELEAAKKCLTRYYWMGLLHRRRGLYSISTRGEEQLEYLQSLIQ